MNFDEFFAGVPSDVLRFYKDEVLPPRGWPPCVDNHSDWQSFLGGLTTLEFKKLSWSNVEFNCISLKNTLLGLSEQSRADLNFAIKALKLGELSSDFSQFDSIRNYFNQYSCLPGAVILIGDQIIDGHHRIAIAIELYLQNRVVSDFTLNAWVGRLNS